MTTDNKNETPVPVGSGDMVSLRWNAGTPNVREGGKETLWCAVRADNGKTYHRPLVYCNAYIISLCDSCYDAPKTAVPVGDDGDFAWTGWHEEACDQCETQRAFDREIVAWMRMPRFLANPEVSHMAATTNHEK